LRIHRIGTAEDAGGAGPDCLDYVRMPAEEFIDRFPATSLAGSASGWRSPAPLCSSRTSSSPTNRSRCWMCRSRPGFSNCWTICRGKLGLAVLYISHDIATVGYICDRVGVMYLGRVVEEGPNRPRAPDPLHPYTERLMAAIPDVDPTVRRERVELEGEVPSPLNVPPGCRFATRCPYASSLCHEVEPELVEVAPDHRVRCHLYRTRQRRPARESLSFSRLFSEARLQVAASHLCDAGGPGLAEIGFLAGFSDQAHFARTFHRNVGRTPGTYRADFGRR
jgi:oligopeptide/dipeptide ABC transporter ATP-binding protein